MLALDRIVVEYLLVVAAHAGHPNRGVVEQAKREHLAILSIDCKIDGGLCDVVMVKKHGGQKVGKLLVNGADARKLKKLCKKLLKTVETLTAVFTCNDVKEVLGCRVAMWAQWNACDK
jgi:hypothetical protein